jgi:hypothetical protein
MADEELIKFIEAQGEVVRELERQLLQGCYQALGNRRSAATLAGIRNGRNRGIGDT